MNNDVFYKDVLLAGVGVCFALGLCMLFYTSPKQNNARHFARCRIWTALGILVLGVMWLIHLLFDPRNSSQHLAGAVNVSCYAFMFDLFEMAYCTSINPSYVTRRVVINDLCFTALVLAFEWIGVGIGGYLGVGLAIVGEVMVGLVYIWLGHTFMKMYIRSMRNSSEYLADDVESSVSWLWKSLVCIILAALGSAALALAPKSWVGFQVLAGIVLVFYIFFAVTNFLANKTVLAPIKTIGQVSLEDMDNDQIEALEERIDEWRKDGGAFAKQLTIEQAAREIGTNRTYLSSYVNGVLQKTFFEWIRSLRIKEAKRLMIEKPGLTLDEISYHVGFTSPSTFSFFFREETGRTPSAWRKNHPSNQH